MATTLIIRTLGQRPQLLRRAVTSALAQSEAEVRVIVVGDGMDPTALLQPLHDPRLHVLAIPKLGRSAAGNAGLAATTTEFAGFLDDDDVLLPDHVRLLEAALAAAPDAVATYARAVCLSVNGNNDTQLVRSRYVNAYRPFSLAELWLCNQMPIQAVLFRRHVFQIHGGFDTSLDALEDWDLWLRYTQAGRFIALPDITSQYALPAGHLAMQARSRDHTPALNYLRHKHASLSAQIRFQDIQALDEYIRQNSERYVNAGIRFYLRQLWRRLCRNLCRDR